MPACLQVDFDGPYPIEGAKQVASVATRNVARLVRSCAPSVPASHPHAWLSWPGRTREREPGPVHAQPSERGTGRAEASSSNSTGRGHVMEGAGARAGLGPGLGGEVMGPGPGVGVGGGEGEGGEGESRMGRQLGAEEWQGGLFPADCAGAVLELYLEDGQGQVLSRLRPSERQ